AALAPARNARTDVEERPGDAVADEVADPSGLLRDVEAPRLGRCRGDVRRADESARERPHVRGRGRSRRLRERIPDDDHDDDEDGAGRLRREDEQSSAGQTAARSSSRTHGPGGVSSCSTWRYASATSGASVHRSKHTNRGRHTGKNFLLKLCSRSSWKKRSNRRRTARSERSPNAASADARSAFAKTAKLSDSSVTSFARAHAIASTIRNSINPFGVSRRRRIVASDQPPHAGEGTRCRNPPIRPAASSATTRTLSG